MDGHEFLEMILHLRQTNDIREPIPSCNDFFLRSSFFVKKTFNTLRKW